jgi:hypothetical protein
MEAVNATPTTRPTLDQCLSVYDEIAGMDPAADLGTINELFEGWLAANGWTHTAFVAALAARA